MRKAMLGHQSTMILSGHDSVVSGCGFASLRFMSLSLRIFRRLIASVFRRNVKPIFALNLNPASGLAHHHNDHRTPNLHENKNFRFRTLGRVSSHGPDKPAGGGGF
jgi:hypothetical protein